MWLIYGEVMLIQIHLFAGFYNCDVLKSRNYSYGIRLAGSSGTKFLHFCSSNLQFCLDIFMIIA